MMNWLCILDNSHWDGVGGHSLRLLDYFFILSGFLVDEYVSGFGLACICRKQCEEVGNM